MGGFLAPPKLPAPPALPPVEDASAREREERLEALERRRRGRDGLIQTSHRGVLSETAGDARDISGPKTLLGD